ncbi:MAG TPA: helix-turn-helix transcriptional regulator, partial [Polyangia bacterium]
GPLELSWVDEASPYLLAMAKGSVSPPMPRTPLSPRELEVAKLISDGYSTLNVAARLGIGEETVRTLLRRVYAKWRISGRVELTRAFLSRPAP